MLVELGLVEQRYAAVLEVLDGATVVDVARRNGVARQTVHDWRRAYARSGLAGMADRRSKPQSCPHQMARPWRRASSSCAEPIQVGGRAPSATASAAKAPTRCRDARRSIGAWSATA